MIKKTDQNEIQNYLKDASNTSGYCNAVYFPETIEELHSLLADAADKKTAVTVCGNRTGLSGAAVPMGGIVISTEKLNRILEINKEYKFVIAEPGVLLSDLLKELKAHKLYYPPDPTELNCFIGGTVATNASGAKSFKYGATRNFVLSLDVCLSTGEIITLNRNEVFADGYKLILQTNTGRIIELTLPEISMPAVKNAAGFFCKKNMDAIDLFIGSEGTLGIFTRIKLALLEYPEKIFSGVIFFDSEESALNFLTEAREKSFASRREMALNKIDATALEYFNKNSLQFLKRDYSRIPENAEAAVWLEQEYTKENEDAISDLWFKLIEKHNGSLNDSWIAVNEKDRNEIGKFRHSISAKVNEYIALRNFRKLGTDIAVPHSKLLSFYNHLKNEVEKEKLGYVVYGHFGDSHIHLNMLPEDEGEFARAKILYKQFCIDAIKVGGTFSAEHGVGKNKTEYLIEMYGKEAVEKMREIKRKLDQEMILGKGKVFDIK
ncbi:FAD-binding oxidoreductase [Candidatus Parcubacteria bacterium]|nr:MAG: FAD-binding oxidoreductase [Candidatus Parcubacteria bacterium]